jgi:hypothetical protein
MIVSPQHFSEIVSHVRFASRAGASERGRSSRMDIQHPVQVTRLSKGDGHAKFTVLSRDLCQEGMGLFSARPMLKGEQFSVRLPRDEKRSIDVLSVVIFHETIADDMFSVGLQFIRVDTPDPAPRAAKNPDDVVKRISQSVLD